MQEQLNSRLPNFFTRFFSLQGLLNKVGASLQYSRGFLTNYDFSGYSLLQFSEVVANHVEQIKVIADLCHVTHDLTAHLEEGDH